MTNQKHGPGKYTWKDGDTYEATFEHGKVRNFDSLPSLFFPAKSSLDRYNASKLSVNRRTGKLFLNLPMAVWSFTNSTAERKCPLTRTTRISR